MKTNKLFIGGLSWNIDWQELKDICKEYGEVGRVNVIKDRVTGKSKGFWFVEFATVEDAERAKEALDGAEIDGRNVRVDFAQDREQ